MNQSTVVSKPTRAAGRHRPEELASQLAEPRRGRVRIAIMAEQAERLAEVDS